MAIEKVNPLRIFSKGTYLEVVTIKGTMEPRHFPFSFWKIYDYVFCKVNEKMYNEIFISISNHFISMKLHAGCVEIYTCSGSIGWHWHWLCVYLSLCLLLHDCWINQLQQYKHDVRKRDVVTFLTNQCSNNIIQVSLTLKY